MLEKEDDDADWHNIQAPEEMLVLRKHDFDEDARYLLRKWLRLERPKLKIVEMGSGSGYFTEQLLTMANNPSIVCIEPDDVLREYAKKRLGRKVTFKRGSVEDPPLPENLADLVICHVLLCNLPDIKAGVSGMIKVAKYGGTICAIEPGLSGGYSSDPRAKLIVEGHSANIDGAWVKRRELIDYSTEYPYHFNIYPKIFANLGLSHIEVHALAGCYFSGDWRLTKENRMQDAKEWLDLLDNHKERYEANLKRCGWKKDRIEEFFKAWREYHTEALRNPENILDHSLYMKCSIVTIGEKK
ncbi:MAG: class I SAM-dependent methyltransferase [Candidatus Bathyarchaeota archaeon]|nr:class I SAM-dependent methyltransferase [Candidatus Bathyarchaeota archaeon]